MAWGALMGLGSGMQQLGGELMDMNKRQLAEKLAREREERAEERTVAREARRELLERQKVSETIINPDTGMKSLRNAYGDTIREEAMSQHELDALARDRQKEEASIQKALADSSLASAKANTFEEDRQLDREAIRARINASNASAGSSNRANRGLAGALTGANADVGTGQRVNDLLAANKTLVDDLTKGTENNPALYTVDELTELAEAARRSAIGADKDVNHTFQILMRREAAKRRANRTTSGL